MAEPTLGVPTLSIEPQFNPTIPANFQLTPPSLNMTGPSSAPAASSMNSIYSLQLASQAGSATLQTIGQIVSYVFNSATQDIRARMNNANIDFAIEGQDRVANSKIEQTKFENDKQTALLENTERKNKQLETLREAEMEVKVAEAELTEKKTTRETSRTTNRKLKGLFSDQRSSYPYGMGP